MRFAEFYKKNLRKPNLSLVLPENCLTKVKFWVKPNFFRKKFCSLENTPYLCIRIVNQIVNGDGEKNKNFRNFVP